MTPLNILIVDDSAVVAQILHNTLTKLGHKVVATAKNGVEAVSAFAACMPDCVFMDVTMPVMDGITATGKIMADFPDARVIIITSHADKDVVMNAQKAGAKGYILKPFQPETIRYTLQNLVQANLGGTHL
jgi:two-component system, chemotaxis family, chemotaxis protein CheY